MAQNEDFMIELQKVCENDPASLSPEQAAFIRARSSYLTDEQKEKFAEVLAEQPADDAAPEIKMDEIRERAKAVDVKIPVGTKKADALAMVEEAEKAKAEGTSPVTGGSDGQPE